jgi:Na+/H+ antiporter NhaD/arsenite permease-like protein
MTLYQYIIAAVTLITLAGIAIGSYPVLKMNRATISLVGATILILIGAITKEDAYHAIDFDTITLLFAMMVINVNLRLAGFFSLVTDHVIRLARSPRQLLVYVIITSGFLSALFLNDTVCIVLTPLIIEITLSLKRNPMPYLMATATASNIGSAATIVGNPQNMIIGIASKIPFTQFALTVLPMSFGGLIICFFVIVLVYKKEFPVEKFTVVPEHEVRIFKPLFRKSIIAACIMLVLFILNVPVPLAALVSASILLITRRVKPSRVFLEVDWSLLVFFAALFIVTGAIGKSGLSTLLFHSMESLNLNSVGMLTVISSALSNIISNVPAVLLFLPVIPMHAHPYISWITLAVATTFAGNLTLMGSVANLIVAESAKRKGIDLSFMEYLKSGLLIAVLSLVYGAVWIQLFIR